MSSGSIPASAGQPQCQSGESCQPRVYPRECGATVVCSGLLTGWRGLSPRVRGNPSTLGRGTSRHRSIPASAGQPVAENSAAGTNVVYPRECGATQVMFLLHSSKQGLSPRVRGNPAQDIDDGGDGGSIPASAGQPQCSGWGDATLKVYPRECGATDFSRTDSAHVGGLSPRVRGNLRRIAHYNRRVRSIPASAGQPSRSLSWTRCSRVYPRECGATSDRIAEPTSTSGLSPRVRGNHWDGLLGPLLAGSIPASAGQPQ